MSATALSLRLLLPWVACASQALRDSASRSQSTLAQLVHATHLLRSRGRQPLPRVCIFGYTYDMPTRSILWSVAFGFMVLASVFLLFSHDPEQTEVASDDGVVTITGVARDTVQFVLTPAAVATSSVLFGSAYDIAPSGAVLDEPVVLSFRLAGVPVPPGEVVVYRYNDDMLLWEMVLPIVAHTDELIAIETASLGRFMLGVREEVALPNYVEVYDDLVDAPPSDAVGYVIAVGYSRPNEPAIRLSGAGEQGGCGGAVRPGVREERTLLMRDASLLVNDVATPLQISFLVRWFIHDAVGCPSGSPFYPADDYGILPTS